MAIDAKSHYDRNRETYDTIDAELSNVRQKFESVSRIEQKTLLFDAVTFAVLSVQAPVSQLAKAFRGVVTSESWDEVQNSLSGINYGKNKFRYTKHNFEAVMGADGVIESLENGDTWDAVESIVDKFLGVSWIKGAFVPAILGYTDVLCIDTNVAQAVDGAISSRGYDSLRSYQGAVGYVKSQFPDLSRELSAFMLQWVAFDANRGESVQLHPEWFEHVLDDPTVGEQHRLSDY